MRSRFLLQGQVYDCVCLCGGTPGEGTEGDGDPERDGGEGDGRRRGADGDPVDSKWRARGQDAPAEQDGDGGLGGDRGRRARLSSAYGRVLGGGTAAGMHHTARTVPVLLISYLTCTTVELEANEV